MSALISDEIDNAVFQKLMSEAFDLLFEGKDAEANTIFSAVNAVKPGNRPSALGLEMVDLLQKQRSGRAEEVSRHDYKDTVMWCLQGLILLRNGRTTDALALLDSVAEGDDLLAARLARDIVQFEIEGR